MHKKECKDSHARVCLSRLTRVLDMDILEDLQELEQTGNVSRNLEMESNLKRHRTFFTKSSEKINKMMNRKGRGLKSGFPWVANAEGKSDLQLVIDE